MLVVLSVVTVASRYLGKSVNIFGDRIGRVVELHGNGKIKSDSFYGTDGYLVWQVNYDRDGNVSGVLKH